MNYQVIEDCSPYYIRFTHDKIENVTNACKQAWYIDTGESFIHHRFTERFARQLMLDIPMSSVIEFNMSRVSLFVTQPGYAYRAHKDGLACKFSLNYSISVLDDTCVTSWYSDQELAQYPIDKEFANSRECDGFVNNKHIPLKTMIVKQNECILFNTDIFHSFDNCKSVNTRVILTLRDNISQDRLTFDDVKILLFGV